MAASVLTLSERKRALSFKKKKKVVKNILGLPESVKIDSFIIDEKEEKSLYAILERLLPGTENFNLLNDQLKEESSKTLDNKIREEKKQLKIKRKELALGVNELHRSVKKNTISAALIASDVFPKLLTYHLNLLCVHNKVPYLHVPQLRKMTNKYLGFPCIALGFKKDSTFFNELIMQIQTIVNSKNNSPANSDKFESSESDSEESDVKEKNNDITKKSFSNFTYLYRSSTNERAFNPETYFIKNSTSKAEFDFISIEDKNNQDDNNDKMLLSQSLKIGNNEKKFKKKKSYLSQTKSSDSDEEQYKVPKKKVKWNIDKIGSRSNFKYSPANLVKLQSNENRKKKKEK